MTASRPTSTPAGAGPSIRHGRPRQDPLPWLRTTPAVCVDPHSCRRSRDPTYGFSSASFRSAGFRSTGFRSTGLASPKAVEVQAADVTAADPQTLSTRDGLAVDRRPLGLNAQDIRPRRPRLIESFLSTQVAQIQLLGPSTTPAVEEASWLLGASRTSDRSSADVPWRLDWVSGTARRLRRRWAACPTGYEFPAHGHSRGINPPSEQRTWSTNGGHQDQGGRVPRAV